MKFEWDSEKEIINIKKHGIDFEIASRIFNDKNRLDFYDKWHSLPEEDRYIVIGMVEDVLYVVYTERNDAIRLISARVATAKEKELYSYGYN